MRSKRVIASLLLVFMVMTPVALLVSIGVQPKFETISQTRIHTNAQVQSLPISITSNSDFMTVGATGVGTRADPYNISGLAISTRSGPCINVTGITAYFVIYNCILDAGPDDPVIIFDNVENGQVMLCEITEGGRGVEFLTSNDCLISNTTIYGCWIGVNMNQATNCTTTFSRISSNHRGLLFESSNYIDIVNNSIYSNTGSGLEFSWFAENNTVIGNSFGWNGLRSAILEGNALDNGNNNQFDDGVSIGNAWSDFNDSIPYLILGTSGSNDSYPSLFEDNETPILVDQLDTAIDVETSGNRITWTATDEYPQYYTIHSDGLQMYSSTWSGGDITLDLDPLPVGTFRIELRVFDGAGNFAHDQVLVTVVSFVLGGIGTELVMIASGITVVIFLVIILIIKKMS